MELPVTLIVKAPNQQIEDQTVQCELTWTINMLKQHLSEVYPSKPPKNEQKLIYSGKLLNDGVVLKDILRQYEGQDTHTVHLVCTPKFSPKTTRITPATTPAEQPAVENLVNNARPTVADHRVPNMQWYDNMQFNNVQPNVQPAPNMDPQMMQMMMMQQAFMQAYYTQYQYMNMNFRQNYTNQPQDVPGEAPVAQPQPPAPPAAANLPRDNPELNRDWLDVFYMLSRTMIFISIVYFYSSPVRCVVVVALAFSLYLYQIGFFRNVNINNNNIVAGDPVAAAAGGGGAADAQPAPAAAGNDAQDVLQPTRLMILWTFFTTFFASLLPEIPNVV
ncbi:homocysteine-responsive endoplasmic reticulum-resident ubiquitin-like domain member 2 protein isoform X1 [Atheta coriaria]|uniref:homocysteine-responsive endoplasmic reticulum-resident ubiquitin-like domain member 2 protein isoform X1 n=1 Tax=Dalotia coriaria TaxID=877792 RepID=UPI0031F3A3D5